MKLIAHRGCALQAPENSLAGIRYTASRAIEHIECDISVASDDVAVVFHDAYLGRMTGDRRSVLACRSDELCRMPLYFRNQPTQETIPLATDYLRLAKAHRLFVHLELKVHDQEIQRVVDAAIASIASSQIALNALRISSFSLPALTYCHTQLPGAAYGIACHHPVEVAHLDCAALGVVSVHANVEAVQTADLAPLKQRGLEVYLYTVNHAASLAHLSADAFDGVFTDDPDALASL